MKQYDTYLFDADGTLLDTTELIFMSFRNTCRTFGGFEIDRDTVRRDIGLPLPVQLKKYLGGKTERELTEIISAHRDYQTDVYRESLKLYDGVKEGLEKLNRQGAVMGIVSSRNRESLDLYLKHTGIFDLFSVFSTPEATKNHKPHPEPVLWAMEQLDARKESTLFTGDAVFDIQSGRDAGVDTALVTWGHNDPEEIAVKPTWIIGDLGDLLS